MSSTCTSPGLFLRIAIARKALTKSSESWKRFAKVSLWTTFSGAKDGWRMADGRAWLVERWAAIERRRQWLLLLHRKHAHAAFELRLGSGFVLNDKAERRGHCSGHEPVVVWVWPIHSAGLCTERHTMTGWSIQLSHCNWSTVWKALVVQSSFHPSSHRRTSRRPRKEQTAGTASEP